MPSCFLGIFKAASSVSWEGPLFKSKFVFVFLPVLVMYACGATHNLVRCLQTFCFYIYSYTFYSILKYQQLYVFCIYRVVYTMKLSLPLNCTIS